MKDILIDSGENILRKEMRQHYRRRGNGIEAYASVEIEPSTGDRHQRKAHTQRSNAA